MASWQVNIAELGKCSVLEENLGAGREGSKTWKSSWITCEINIISQRHNFVSSQNARLLLIYFPISQSWRQRLRVDILQSCESVNSARISRVTIRFKKGRCDFSFRIFNSEFFNIQRKKNSLLEANLRELDEVLFWSVVYPSSHTCLLTLHQPSLVITQLSLRQTSPSFGDSFYYCLQ